MCSAQLCTSCSSHSTLFGMCNGVGVQQQGKSSCILQRERIKVWQNTALHRFLQEDNRGASETPVRWLTFATLQSRTQHWKLPHAACSICERSHYKLTPPPHPRSAFEPEALSPERRLHHPRNSESYGKCQVILASNTTSQKMRAS